MPSCLPHGGYTLLPAVLCTLAWMASLVQDGCDYARLEGPIVKNITGSDELPFLEIGFLAYRVPEQNPIDLTWQVVYSGPCRPYDPELEDGFWVAAKAFAFGALVLGGASALFLWFNTCFAFSLGTWRWAGCQVLFAFICQSFAFLWFGTSMCKNTENTCTLFFGSKADIAAAIFWLVSAIMIFSRYPKPKSNSDVIRQISEERIPAQTSPEDVPIEGNPDAKIDTNGNTKSSSENEGADTMTKLTDAEII
mmetsp:Transcript_19423/g.29195  ORF Transcript_19423/g.29195 Transcript_19423/m.29195 type:complete len:251 (+) Transcript_19423:97-849(+)